VLGAVWFEHLHLLLATTLTWSFAGSVLPASTYPRRQIPSPILSNDGLLVFFEVRKWARTISTEIANNSDPFSRSFPFHVLAFEVRFDALRFGECHGLVPWIVAKEGAPHTIRVRGLSRGASRLSFALAFPSDERKNPRGKPVAFVSAGSRLCSEKRNDPRGEPVVFRKASI
jgi:hypothetical protein